MEDSVSNQFAKVRQRREKRHEIFYDLILRQQPKHSRMCGIGEKGTVQRTDRRPVDPPPIIQLKVIDNLIPSADRNSFLQNPYYFMYASLIVLETSEELHLLRDGRTRSTTGSVVSSLYHLKDIDNADAGFFVFSDLSVRMQGSYRLKFSLFEIVGKKVFHCKSICSEPFTVYSAKRFPGMEESTFLSRSFADQGLKIRIRKEICIRRRLGKRKSDDSVRSQYAKRQRHGAHDEEYASGSGSDSEHSRNASTKQESSRFPEEEYRHIFMQPHPNDARLISGSGSPHYPDDKRGLVMHSLYDPYGPRMGGYYPLPMNSHPGVDPRHPAAGTYHSRISPAYGDPRMITYGYDPQFSDRMMEAGHIGAGHNQTGRLLQRAPPHWISSGRPSDSPHPASGVPLHHPELYYRGMPPPPVLPVPLQHQRTGRPATVYYGSGHPLAEFEVDPRGQPKIGYPDEMSTTRSGVQPPHPAHRPFYGYPVQNSYDIYSTYHPPRHDDTYNSSTSSSTATYTTENSTRTSEATNSGVDLARSSNLEKSPVSNGSTTGTTCFGPLAASVKPQAEIQPYRVSYPSHLGVPIAPYHPVGNCSGPYSQPYHQQQYHLTQQQPPAHQLMQLTAETWETYNDMHKLNGGSSVPLQPVAGTAQQTHQNQDGERHHLADASQSSGADWQSQNGGNVPGGDCGGGRSREVAQGPNAGKQNSLQPEQPQEPLQPHDNLSAGGTASGDGDASSTDHGGCSPSTVYPPSAGGQ